MSDKTYSRAVFLGRRPKSRVEIIFFYIRTAVIVAGVILYFIFSSKLPYDTTMAPYDYTELSAASTTGETVTVKVREDDFISDSEKVISKSYDEGEGEEHEVEASVYYHTVKANGVTVAMQTVDDASEAVCEFLGIGSYPERDYIKALSAAGEDGVVFYGALASGSEGDMLLELHGTEPREHEMIAGLSLNGWMTYIGIGLAVTGILLSLFQRSIIKRIDKRAGKRDSASDTTDDESDEQEGE